MCCWHAGKCSIPIAWAVLGELTGMQYRYDVVVTVRSEEKGQKILEAHPNTPKEKLSFVIVKDVAADGAFDEVRVLFSPEAVNVTLA
jgi:hypothetical protein